MRTTSLLLVACLFAAEAVFGQDTTSSQDDAPEISISEEDTWRILLFEDAGSEAVVGVQQHIEAGFVPVGLEVSLDTGMHVLVTRLPGVSVGRWAIVDYDDWNKLEDEITASIADGFVPMDISRYGDVLAVLWVETDDIVVDGWRISTAANTATQKDLAIERFGHQQFSVWGTSKHENLAWFLFLRERSMQPGGFITTYSISGNEVAAGIAAAAATDWTPIGIATDETAVDIIFAREMPTME